MIERRATSRATAATVEVDGGEVAHLNSEGVRDISSAPESF